MLTPSDRLGPYEIIAPLGAGGMGEVYLARDTRLGRDVAIKILPEQLAANPEARQRFEREARAVALLNHPNICTLYDIGQDSRTDFLVMEYLEGQTLAQEIRRGPLRVPKAVDITAQVARGLAAAHARGIVHRDIKPSNIGFNSGGVAKIIDFGLARITSATVGAQSKGVTTGTIGYMSPEQTVGQPVDARTDVWALGVVFSEMLAGTHPFQRENASAILHAILNEPPTPAANAPLELQRIVYQALAKSPAERYSNAEQMADDLEMFRASGPAVDPSAPTATLRREEIGKFISHASSPSWKPASARRGRSLWWLAALALPLLALLTFAVPSLRSRIREAFSGTAEKHIAVLPFDNIGNDSRNAPLAEGLMDSISSALSNLDVNNQSLWVVPSSVVRARKVDDPSAALRELGATLVVKGSLERDGQGLQLTVNLINAKTLRQIGSARLEDAAGDLATLQDETVSRLAKMMGIGVTPDMLRHAGAKVDPAAYQSYLTALSYVQRWDKPGNLDSAITALNDAVKSDSSFALGYAELGEAYRRKNQVDPNPRWIDEATANCDKALQLNDRLPAPYVTLGLLHTKIGKRELALEEFQHALQIDPRDADALGGLARAYEQMDRISDAEAALKRAAALRPDYWDGYNALAMFYDRQRRYKDALAELDHVIELTPDNAPAYSNLAAVYLDMDDPKVVPQAEQALMKSIQLAPSYPSYANLGMLYFNEKKYAESAAATEEALKLNDKNYQVWENLAIAYEWLKERNKANVARQRAISLLTEEAKANPQDAMVQSYLALSYGSQKLRDQALIHVQSALALSTGDPEILVNAGETYEDLGDRASAIKYIEQGLKKGYPLAQLQNNPDVQALLHDPNFHPDGKP